MPTLQFKGKNIIWNHHLAVPFHTLDEISDLHYNPEKANGNTIIEGDNLIALKSLLPQFAGKVKCIYIDPPYNTGNEGWIYNDKVNSPLIKEWIGKEVGADDLTRHDKWLCMMTPRLKLLRELLTEDGTIFISIDENEFNYLKSLLNEIFGENQFVTQLTVLCNPKGRSQDKYFATNHEYVIAFSKNELPKGYYSVEKDPEQIKEEYPEENDIGKYRLLELRNTHREFGKHNRKNLYYPFYVNKNGEISLEKSEDTIEVFPIWDDGFEGCWTWDFKKAEADFEFLEAREVKGKWKIYRKSYASGVEKMLKTIWNDKSFHTEKGQKIFNELFNIKGKLFNAPKSVDLIKTLIKTITKENDIILDAFSGTGTTMHAVMDLNKEDGGNRQCIMVQMTEATEHEPEKNICKDITRERIKRAINKFDYDSGFKYFRVGIPLDAETMLAGQLPTYKQFAKYVYYLCTGENLDKENGINEETFFVGEFGKQAIYLVYKQDYDTLTRLALNLSMAERIKKEQPGKKRIVYAPSCFLDEEYLTDNQIDYVGIPYNLFQRTEK
ncbi:MAG: site-specific DNA-methyltransferase [Prolixibacteraceae bacterium]|nr:site-specific DNA-methyltransferase [Prolixibacteraceae bacterium]